MTGHDAVAFSIALLHCVGLIGRRVASLGTEVAELGPGCMRAHIN